MFCSWLHCLLGMMWYTWSTSLLPLWCRCNLDSPFLLWHLYHNMDAPVFIYTKEEQRAVSQFLWAEIVTGAKMHRRISVQYGDSVVSQQMAYEWIERLRNGRTSIKNEKEMDVHSCPLLMQTRNKSLTWSCRTDVWLLMKWHINWKLVVVEPMKLSTTGLLSVESFHDGSKSNSRNCIKRMFGYLQMAFGSLWCWRWPLFGKNCHRRWNIDSPLWARE